VTLLLTEVGALLAGAALWLAVVVMLCAVPGLAVVRLRRATATTVIRASVVAGVVVAGLAGRLGLGDPVTLEVMGRPIPVASVLGGACIGAVLAGWRRRGVSGRGEGSAAIPARDATRP